MEVSKTNSSGSHDWSSCICNLGIFLSNMLLNISESWLNIGPWSSILGLFLAPGNFSILVLLQLTDNFLEWEWTERFSSENGNISSSKSFSLSFKIIINLTATKYYFLNLIGSNEIFLLISNKWLPS